MLVRRGLAGFTPLPCSVTARILFFSDRAAPPATGGRPLASTTPAGGSGALRREAPSPRPAGPAQQRRPFPASQQPSGSPSSRSPGAGAGAGAGAGSSSSSFSARPSPGGGSSGGGSSASGPTSGAAYWSSVRASGAEALRLVPGLTPLGSRPSAPSSLPPTLLSAEHGKARTGDQLAPLSSLTANPYGWRDEARAARAAPLWMLYEEDRTTQPPPKRAASARAASRRRSTLILHRERDAKGRAYAVGGRKTSSARVWVGEGDGLFTINQRPLQEYFERMGHRLLAMEPLTATQAVGAFNVDVSVRGGGLSGQAGAIRQGLAKALAAFDPNLKPVVKALGMTVRDPRMVERKKPGQRKARAKFQWVRR